MTEPAPPPGRRRRLGPWFDDRPIGVKLAMGLGAMVALTLVVIAIGLVGGARATASIDQTVDQRAPTALASARAQADMLRMVGEVRGYLALGDATFRDAYRAAATTFDADLASLVALADRAPADDPIGARLRGDLASLRAAYAQWQPLPDQLFAIRDDQLRREPALRILIEDATPQIAAILNGIAEATRLQSLRPPTAQNLAVLGELGAYNGAFLSEVSGLRGYVTTGRGLFKFEYQANQTVADTAWQSLLDRRPVLDAAQNAALDEAAAARDKFAPMPANMFEFVEGDRSREDLFQFRTEAVPLADRMIATLDGLATSEQQLLSADLATGRDGLAAARLQALVLGAILVAVAILVAFAITRGVAGPIRRLTSAAQRIRGGDLAFRAEVESRDELGTLASAFNAMTGQLADTIETQQEYIREVGVVTDAAVAVEASEFQPGALSGVAGRSDALGALARTFEKMASEVKAREERLRAQVRELKIEIDEARQAKKVAEITDTDYFRSLRGRASDLRRIVGTDVPPEDTSGT